MPGLRLAEALPPTLLARGEVDRRESFRAERVLVGRLPRPDVNRRDRRGVLDPCGPDVQRYLPAEEETYFATAWIWAGVSFPANAGITPPPTVT